MVAAPGRRNRKGTGNVGASQLSCSSKDPWESLGRAGGCVWRVGTGIWGHVLALSGGIWSFLGVTGCLESLGFWPLLSVTGILESLDFSVSLGLFWVLLDFWDHWGFGCHLLLFGCHLVILGIAGILGSLDIFDIVSFFLGVTGILGSLVF